MTVHRRVFLTSAVEPSDPGPDPFAIRLAGRHSYDRVSRGYFRPDQADGPPILSHLVRAYQDVYPAPAEGPSRAEPDATAARFALQDVAGDDYIENLPAAIERAFDVDVIRAADIGGDFALETAGRAVIVVGETPSWFFQNWSLAHELGHILRHDLVLLGEDPPGGRTAERAANAFAAELLLPRTLVESIDWSRMDEPALADLVWSTGVSTKALASRLVSLKLAVPPQVRKMLATATLSLVQRGSVAASSPPAIAQRSLDAATRRFPPDLIEAHVEAVDDGRIAPTSLEWMLGG